MSYYGNGQFANSFNGPDSYTPLVGVLLNKYENFSEFTQGLYSIAAGAGQAVAGDPVTVLNRVSSTANTAAIESMNAGTSKITAKASTIANLDGFLLQSPQDVVPSAGGEAYPVAGFLSYVALLGSGAQLYLAADSRLADVGMSTPLTWDFNNNVVKAATVNSDIVLPIRLKSALVDAKQLVYSSGTGLAAWDDCKAVLVSLDWVGKTIESSN